MNCKALLALALVACNISAADRAQGRSMVISKHGIVASEHPMASQAGAMILAEGGTAVDAAIAANAVMGVVAPMMCGMGGDLFVMVYEAKSDKIYALNASGWAPSSLTPEMLRNQGITNKMPKSGINSVTIPGAVAGWEQLLRRFGRKNFAQVLEPAIQYAREGFPVSELVAGYWSSAESLLRQDESATRTYLPQGHPLRVGEIFKNPDLAWSYQQIADHGAKGFYQGPIAQKLLGYAKRKNAPWTKEDLKLFSPEWVEPISTVYHGWTVFELPPNGQGIAALSMLNIMEQFPLSTWGPNTTQTLHAMIEAKKLAYADMFHFAADPKFARTPVAAMLSKSYAAQRAHLIDGARANCDVTSGASLTGGSDTTYLCVVDREGNMVSYIQSNFDAFGSGLVADGTGFALHDRAGLFSLDPNQPNVLAVHKRPLHTIIPAMMRKENLRMAFGIMGGWNQSQAHAQFVANVVDHNMNIQAALEAPRFTKLSFDGCDVQMEARIPAEIRAELEAKGHQIKVIDSFAQAVGGGQAVLRDFTRQVNYGASDPRKDGEAIPEP